MPMLFDSCSAMEGTLMDALAKVAELVSKQVWFN
jgi:hypothetical protein